MGKETAGRFVAFAAGLAAGIVVAWAVGNPVLAWGLLIWVALVIVAVLTIQGIRTAAAIAAIEYQARKGRELYQRLFVEPVTMSADEDRAFWFAQLETWNSATEDAIHEHIDAWHQRYQQWSVSSSVYRALPIQRNQTALTLAAKLQALAEIRTRL